MKSTETHGDTQRHPTEDVADRASFHEDSPLHLTTETERWPLTQASDRCTDCPFACLRGRSRSARLQRAGAPMTNTTWGCCSPCRGSVAVRSRVGTHALRRTVGIECPDEQR